MRPQKTHMPQESIYPFLGMNDLSPSSLTDPHFSPKCDNVTVTDGILSKRRGYSDLAVTTVTGTILGVIEYESGAGAKSTVCVTTTKVYKYNSTTNAWDDISGGTAWTGDEDDNLDWCIAKGTAATDDTWLIMVNGQGKAHKWNGTGNVQDLAVDIASFASATTVEIFNNHLLLGAVNDGGSNPQTVYWSVANDFEDWTGTGSGVALIADLEGEIVRIENLADRSIIYTTDSIAAATYVGGDAIFTFERLVRNTRLISGRAVVPVGPYHFFLSQENFYIFDGSRLIKPIGDAVKKDYRTQVDLDQLGHAFGFHDPAKKHIYWGIPTSATSTRIYLQEYDLYDISRQTWVPFTYSMRATAMGFFTRTEAGATSTAWEDFIATDLWSTVIGAWREGSLRSGFPIHVIAGVNNTYLNDHTKAQDDAVDFEGYWESIDFVVPSIYKSVLGRWLEVEVEVKGLGNLTVTYSVDQGATFTTPADGGTIALTPTWTKYRVLFDGLGRSCRVKVSNTTGTFDMRWMRIWLRVKGPR